MAPKKKEYCFDLRETVIKHFLNSDSENDIAGKMIIPRNSVHYIITKYKKTKCIENIIGRGRKHKTSMHLDRITQRKVKVDRRKSASSVKIDIESELGITISEQTVRRRLQEIGLKGRVTRKKPYINKVNRGKRLEYGIMYYGLMKVNLICLGRMAKLWCGGHRRKSLIQNALFRPWSTAEEM